MIVPLSFYIAGLFTLDINLFQILLKNMDFDGALNILDQACSEEIQLDILLFNTILQAACDKVFDTIT